MQAYKHGVYGETGSASNVVDTTQVTTPVYIGTLPMHRLDESKLSVTKHYIDDDVAMFLISSIKDVKKLNLMSNDWEAYSLCEAIDAHFVLDSAVAPIILIAKNGMATESESTTATVNLAKSGKAYIGYIDDSKADITDMALSVSGTTFEDGEVSYEYDGDLIKIVITKDNFTATSVGVTYKKITGDKMDVTAFEKCLDVLDRAENITNRVPNIICAPQYSDEVEYHDLMVQKAIDKIGGKWNCVVASDIGEVADVEGAIAWKKTNSYNNVLEKVCYPKLGYKGKKYHMSTIWTATSQALDMDSDNVPHKSASNKAVIADAIYSNKDDSVMYISEEEANTLNKNGITTAITTKGQIRLWGSHMGNYDFDFLSGIAEEDRFDVAVRMSVYLRNHLQYSYLDEIDESIGKKDIDGIVNSVQMWLDSLVNESKLLYATVEFDEDSDLANGDIVFALNVTYPLVAKSITFKVKYTNAGIIALTEAEEGVEE